MADPVPSAEFPDGETALRSLLAGAREVRAAVAFVSLPGARLLTDLLRSAGIDGAAVELVARAAPITSPEALIQLRDEAGVRVSVIAGDAAPGFHPKLWLIERADGLAVLSGSGNLTGGGMGGNQEQFELYSALEGEAAARHRDRYAALTEGAIPLDLTIGSIAWREWQAQQKERARLGRETERLDRALVSSPAVDLAPAARELFDDLWKLYDRIRAARLRKPDGDIYYPGYLRLALEGKRGSTDPVRIVGRLCGGEEDTGGFAVMLEANQPELAVESLVIDASKGYHPLFPAALKERARERMTKFPPPGE